MQHKPFANLLQPVEEEDKDKLDVHLEMNSLIKSLLKGTISPDVFLGRVTYLEGYLRPGTGWRFGDYLPK